MEELHQRFLEQQLPRRYTNLAAEKMLVEKYRAIEIPAEVLADLQRDPLANFEQVFKCFKIEDRDVLNRIYSDTEKGIQEEHKARYEEREAEDRPLEPSEKEWIRIRNGELLRVVLTSEDGEHMLGFTVQGLCYALVDDLMIMKGIPQGEECSLNNEYYVHYLQLLQRQGHL
ncbi:hypothetical protein [Paenibacillus alvei]|uniref:hypothetical protein n=1 Tax=Paenibacillus alvei TaxID=44250 RepID=UPI00227FD141|nr:hypothetical protein [Paenibacillus alvei]